MKKIETLAFKYKEGLWILDQSLLPEKEVFLPISHPKEMILAIKTLKVRGANLIGICAALSLADHCLKRRG